MYFYDGHGNVVQLVNEKIDKFICKYMGAKEFPQEADFNGDGIVSFIDLSGYLEDYPATQNYKYDPFGNRLDKLDACDTNPFQYCG